MGKSEWQIETGRSYLLIFQLDPTHFGEPMDIHEAQKVIRDDNASFIDHVLAAGILSTTKETPLDDLLVCLKRGGLMAEMAACTLYNRTKRERAKGEPFVMDLDDWTRYLKLNEGDRLGQPPT